MRQHSAGKAYWRYRSGSRNADWVGCGRGDAFRPKHALYASRFFCKPTAIIGEGYIVAGNHGAALPAACSILVEFEAPPRSTCDMGGMVGIDRGAWMVRQPIFRGPDSYPLRGEAGVAFATEGWMTTLLTGRVARVA